MVEAEGAGAWVGPVAGQAGCESNILVTFLLLGQNL